MFWSGQNGGLSQGFCHNGTQSVKKNCATITSRGVYCLDTKDFCKDFCTSLLIGPPGTLWYIHAYKNGHRQQMRCADPRFSSSEIKTNKEELGSSLGFWGLPRTGGCKSKGFYSLSVQPLVHGYCQHVWAQSVILTWRQSCEERKENAPPQDHVTTLSCFSRLFRVVKYYMGEIFLTK